MAYESVELWLAAAGLVLVIALWLVDRFWVRRNRLSYRVQLDTAVGVAPQGAEAFGLQVVGPDGPVDDASIALVRIRNVGSGDIAPDEFASPLTLEFPGRTVQGFDVTQPTPPDLQDVLATVPKDARGDRLVIDPFPLNRGHSFKLLVRLAGRVGEVRASTYLKGGRLTYDSNRAAPSYRSLAFGAAALLFAGTLTGFVIADAVRPPGICESGELVVTGSTAFEPIMQAAVDDYRGQCPGAEITVASSGSIEGMRDLARDVRREDSPREEQSVRDSVLVMSDVEAEDADLIGRQVGILVFTMVVNEATGIESLTTEQVRALHAGEYRTWADVDPRRGSREPVVLVSRDSQSGTRAVFQEEVLDRLEGGATSTDCETLTRVGETPAADVPVRCEWESTDDLLAEVDANPGAVGYVQLGFDATRYPGVRAVPLDGREASIDAVRDGDYPFWSREQLYTFGIPREDTLLRAFVDYVAGVYLLRPEVQSELVRNGFEPVGAPD
ncbi:MAG: substrate-binding domain-containing protein [Kineosporiaceae bacterium]